MAKLSDFLKEVLKPVFEKQEDLDLFVSASAMREIEVPDNVINGFNSKYMTRERAFNDEEVVRKFSRDALGKAYGTVDNKLKKILPLLKEEDRNKIESETDTPTKLELLESALKNLSDNEDVKKINESWRKKEEDLRNEIKTYQDQLKKKDENFNKEIENILVDTYLRNKMNSFELAPEFSESKRKEFLQNSTINSLKSSFVLEYDREKQSITRLGKKHEDGTITDVFEGNTKLTLDDVLKKEFEPFIKKNNSETKGHNQQPKPVQAQAPSDKPMTLREMQRQTVEANS